MPSVTQQSCPGFPRSPPFSIPVSRSGALLGLPGSCMTPMPCTLPCPARPSGAIPPCRRVPLGMGSHGVAGSHGDTRGLPMGAHLRIHPFGGHVLWLRLPFKEALQCRGDRSKALPRFAKMGLQGLVVMVQQLQRDAGNVQPRRGWERRHNRVLEEGGTGHELNGEVDVVRGVRVSVCDAALAGRGGVQDVDSREACGTPEESVAMCGSVCPKERLCVYVCVCVYVCWGGGGSPYYRGRPTWVCGLAICIRDARIFDRPVVTAVHAWLRMATFCGYARLRPAEVECGARLRTLDYHFRKEELLRIGAGGISVYEHCLLNKSPLSILGQPIQGWRPTRPSTINYKQFNVSSNRRCPRRMCNAPCPLRSRASKTAAYPNHHANLWWRCLLHHFLNISNTGRGPVEKKFLIPG